MEIQGVAERKVKALQILLLRYEDQSVRRQTDLAEEPSLGKEVGLPKGGDKETSGYLPYWESKGVVIIVLLPAGYFADPYLELCVWESFHLTEIQMKKIIPFK